MYSCANCHIMFPMKTSGAVHVRVEGQSDLAASLCPGCTSETKVMKIALRRQDDGKLAFDGYQPVEAIKKAFGR